MFAIDFVWSKITKLGLSLFELLIASKIFSGPWTNCYTAYRQKATDYWDEQYNHEQNELEEFFC
jgi:hypothetical protein